MPDIKPRHRPIARCCHLANLTALSTAVCRESIIATAGTISHKSTYNSPPVITAAGVEGEGGEDRQASRTAITNMADSAVQQHIAPTAQPRGFLVDKVDWHELTVPFGFVVTALHTAAELLYTELQ